MSEHESPRVASFILPVKHPRGARYDPAHQSVVGSLLREFGGYTALPVTGAWIDPDGRTIHDASIRYDVAALWAANQRSRLATIAHDAGVSAAQQCVFVQWDTGEVEFLQTH